MTPTSRTLAVLRSEAWTVAIVEHWNPYAKIRQDLFGLFDLIALKVGEPGVLGVQCCAGSGHAAHRDKMQASPILPIWWQTGNHAVIYSWAKQGKAGSRKVWTLRTERIYPPLESKNGVDTRRKGNPPVLQPGDTDLEMLD